MALNPFLYARPSDEVGHLATVTVATGTEDAQFPASRICDWTNEFHTSPAKVTGTGAAAWLFDWGSAQRVDWIVVWHNFDAAIDVRWKMGSTTGVLDLNAAVTIPARTLDGFTVKVLRVLTGVTGYSAGGFRYGKLEVPSATVAAGVKMLIFSRARDVECHIQPAPRAPNTERSIVLPTDFQHEWIYRLFAPQRQFSAMAEASSADLVDLRAWFQDCGGHAQVTSFVFDRTVNEALICRFNALQTEGLVTSRLDPTLFVRGVELHPVELAFTEITSGLPEWE